MRPTQEALARIVEREGVTPRIVEAFRAVRRDEFVPEEARDEAYADHPIPIPEAQTTSQPTLIARMLDAVAPAPTDKALEVGTGYGFQTALLARLTAKVVSVDRRRALAEAARANLRRAGIANAAVVVGDGSQGWRADAPFDVIVVSAAAREVPVALADQLAEGGRLVIPLTGALGDRVTLFAKEGGELKRKRLVSPARFVPLVTEGR